MCQPGQWLLKKKTFFLKVRAHWGQEGTLRESPEANVLHFHAVFTI